MDESKTKSIFRDYQEERKVKASLLHLNDTGNAERLAIYYGEKLRYCWDSNEWLFWDGKRWNSKLGREGTRQCAKKTARKILEEANIKEATKERADTAKWAFQSEQESRLNAMISLARSEKPIAAYKEDFDKDLYLLNCKNGVVNLKTGGLTPHLQDLMITRLANVPFEEDAICQVWLKCLDTWMNGDEAKIDYLKRMLGMCLTGDICARAFPIFYGGGFNGKSSCLDTVTEILGDYASIGMESLLEQKTLPQHPCDIADLAGKRLIVVDETKENMRLRTALVKRMTGDRKLRGRFMRQNPFGFNTTHKTIMMTQHLPIITETADAIWDRVHLLNWPVRISEEERDPHLIDKLKEEYSGILNWLICGCIKWQQDGYVLKLPESVESATQQYREESDPLGDFIEDCCDIAPHFFVPVKELNRAYNLWCRDTDVKFSLGKRQFNEKLRIRGCKSKPTRYQNEVGTGQFDKCWHGITLIDNSRFVTESTAESTENQETIPF